MSVEVVPLLLGPDGQPKNPRLREMAAQYAGADFLARQAMLFVALQPDKSNGHHPSVVGVLGLAYSLDFSMHSENPEATLRLFRRAHERAIDNGMEGQQGLVYVRPSEINKWRPLLERIKAQPAERWAFQIAAGIEV